MSDEGKSTESLKDALLGLNSLDFGPAWARGGSEEKKGAGAEARGKHGGDERREERRREHRGDERREGKGGRGRRFDNREREERGRHDGRGRGDRRFEKDKGGRPRRDDERGHPPRDETPPPDGFSATVMPVEEGLDGLAREIMAGGRTYSVFDLAKLVLGARDRFNVSFQGGGEAQLYRCRKDDSLWLSKEEALRQFWRSSWRKDYYEEVVIKATPPAGNFQTIARCGISGEWLGPPNYHGYQPAVARLHRERFSSMPLEAYKRKIRMERGEEAVNAWLERMSKRVRYRPTGGEASAKAGASAAEAAEAQSRSEVGGKAEIEEARGEQALQAESPETLPEEAAASVQESETVEDGAGETADAAGAERPGEAVESDEGSAEEPDPEDVPDAEVTAATTRDEPLLADEREVERHFLDHYFDDAFQVTNRAWVSGGVPGNHISPGLLTLLRHTVAEERRYPGKLTPMLCRQLSGRHVAVFKWRRKLKAGPSRPHPIPSDIAIADRPKALLTWIAENTGRRLQHLWKALLPENVSEEEKRGWYHDLHWLLNQGYVLLMADSSVHIAKKQDEPARPPGGREKPKQSRESAKPAAAISGGKESVAKTEVRLAPVKAVAPRPSGLYAMAGRTLSGHPKAPELLSGRGLWPQARRFEASEEDGEEESDERW